MKYRSLWAFVAFITVLLSACSGKAPKTSDTVGVEPDPTPELPVSDVKDALMTSRGIIPIKVGMRVVDIKPKVENLYDTIIPEKGYDSNTYHFCLNNQERFQAFEFDAGIINLVVATDSSIVVKDLDGNEKARIGNPFSTVLQLPGVKAQWETGDDEGMWVWIWQGIYFIPSQENLTEKLVHKLYNSNVAPSASDFSEDVTVAYMGTGLPW